MHSAGTRGVVQAHRADATCLLLALHCKCLEKMAQHIVKLSETSIVPPAEYDVAMHISRHAVRLAHSLQHVHGRSDAIAPFADMLSAARTLLQSACRNNQRTAIDRCTVGEVEYAGQRAKHTPRLAKVPPPHKGAKDLPCSIEAAVRALAPVPALPHAATVSTGAAAEQLCKWACAACASGGANASVVAAQHVQAWLEGLTLTLNTAQPLSKSQLTHLATLVCEHSKRLQALAAAQLPPVPPVQLKSVGVLAKWVLVCIAHRAVAREWPQVLSYSLPLNADDLRWLGAPTGSCTEAVLRVAAYVSAHCSHQHVIFTTEPGADAATWQLAETFARGSKALRSQLQAERHVQCERVKEHWQAVAVKQAQLKQLDAQLSVAQQQKAHALANEQQAHAQLVQQKDAAASERKCKLAVLQDAKEKRLDVYNEELASRAQSVWGSSWPTHYSPDVELPFSEEMKLGAYFDHAQADDTYNDLQHDVNTATAYSGADSAHSVDSCCTEPGEAWRAARNSFVQFYQRVQELEGQMRATEQPPDNLLHPLPKDDSAALALLFFLHAEHTGCIPLLAQTCFTASQVLHRSVEPHRGDLQRWARYYNETHCACPYAPAQHLCTSAVEAAGLDWVLPATPQDLPGKPQWPSRTVRGWAEGCEHGEFFPDAAQFLLWHGGPECSSADSRLAVQAYPARTTEVQHTAAVHFTEPAQLQRAITCCSVGASRLAGTAGRALSGPQQVVVPPLSDASESDDAQRSNAALASGYRCKMQPDGTAGEQLRHIEGLTREQCVSVMHLRMYGMTQMHLLCAPLHDGTWDAILQHSEVRHTAVLHNMNFQNNL